MATLLEQIATDAGQSGVFFDTAAGFAVSATYTPAGGGATTIKGIFDVPYDPLAPFDPDAFAAQRLTFLTTASSVPLAAKGDTIVIASVTYYLQSGPQLSEDGKVARLLLTKDNG